MQILLLVAHADDETLGAGGTVQRLRSDGHSIQLIVVSDGVIGMRGDGSDNRRPLESACGILGIDDWRCLDFPDQRFDTVPVAEIANHVSEAATNPDLIITHAATDLNSDHRITAEVAKIIGRPRGRPISILACEIPSVSTWNGADFNPNLYVGLSEAQLDKKVEAFKAYKNELRPFPDPYSEEGLRNIARFRGQESGHRAAEAFRVVRWNL